jgi:putative aminopeptidase FrvX
MNLDLLRELSDAPGVPGREERVRDIVIAHSQGLFDQITVDPMGSVLARKKPAGPAKAKVVLACHIDEIGFYVKYIDDKGFLKLVPVGGFDTRNLFARRVKVQSSHGGDLIGLMNPSGRPVHIAKEEDRKKIPEVGDFLVDLCLPVEQVKAKVRIGDPVTLVQSFTQIGDVVTGKAMDDRVSSFVAIEAVRLVTDLKYDLTVAHTVQEEVGLRGAYAAGYAADADIGLAIDVTLAVDMPGVPEDEAVSKLGGGVALTVLDGASIASRSLLDEFERIAIDRQIPHQLSILPRGGTDAAALQRSRGGTRAFTISVPCRNIHTVTEACHTKDLQAAVDLLAAWLQA